MPKPKKTKQPEPNCYKIVSIKGNHFESFNFNQYKSPTIVLKYQIGVPTKPIIPNSHLFVYTNKDAGRKSWIIFNRYKNSGEYAYFEAYAENIVKIKLLPMLLKDEKVLDFWKNFEYENAKDYPEVLHLHNAWASSITLLRRLL